MHPFIHQVSRRHVVRWCVPPLALACVVPAGLTAPSPAMAATSARHQQPTAIVSLGDSFISGEGGRWQGNAVPRNLLGDRWGTDRGAYACNSDGSWCYHDAHRVYGTSYDNGCNRSDSAEIQSAGINVDRRVNLACSGATTANVFRAAQGGQWFKKEAPQADQLASVARNNSVKMVVLSISGNDLGFADVIRACVEGFRAKKHCHADQEPTINTRLVQTVPKVEKAVDEIRAVMAGAGYSNGSSRLVLQSYPSPVPSGTKNRYDETWGERWSQGGCPIYNDDSDWAQTTLVSRISDMLGKVAAKKNLEFLDLRDLFQGHEVCAKSSGQAAQSNSLTNPRPAAVSEWVRFLVYFGSQGDSQESFHPNYFGQIALGTCLAKLYGYTGTKKSHTCTNTPQKGPKEVVLDK
jgi:lysophospholipase L1-like esterase